MRIGVLTFWFGDDNYGMIMQCWALQTFLKNEGHDPYIVKYNPIGSPLKRFVKQMISFSRCLINKQYREEQRIEKENKRKKQSLDTLRGFSAFRQNNLVFSKDSYYNMKSLRTNPPEADAYIAGSDQIWRSSLRYWSTEGFFLQFGEKNTLRIAYAPSFGLKSYPKEELPLLSQALSRFDSISCREFDGVEICREAGFSATKVLDPTLLLSENIYLPLLEDNESRDHIFIYSLNISKPEDIYYDSVKMAFPETKVIVTPSSGYIPSSEVFGAEVKYEYAKPQEWLANIKNASLVVTSSFHGIVFSIIFKTKFAFVPLKGEYSSSNNRVLDLLKSIGMNYAIITDGSDYERIKEIDYSWDEAHRLLEDQINESKLYLRNALSMK